MKISKLFLGSLLSVLCFTAVNAHAEESFAKKHPRRAQVNKRDKNLENKTNAAASSGQINSTQAANLNKEESAIHNQEKADAAANGGKITKGEQRDLNREENRVNRQLKRDERRDAKGKSGSTGSATSTATSTSPTTSN